MTTQFTKAALWYARHGWKVFPLRPGTKEPFKDLGVYQATNDQAQVGQWWQRWPEANIGLHCGGSGLLALDLDQYKDSYNGAGFLTAEDEQTVTNLTGNGGTHLLFALPIGAKFGNQTGNLPPGIDVRCTGGYIVLPPSIHPNGKPYKWEIGYAPHEIEPRPLPHTLRALLEDARTHQRTPGAPDDNAVKIGRLLVLGMIDALGLETHGEQAYGKGRKWILKHCPFNPQDDPHTEDRGAFLCVYPDGYIAAGCWHTRCRERLHAAKTTGWQWLLREVCS
jgi:hypothetical protein